MLELLGAAGSAAWLGILTSISPCPLATNIAAVSYIGRHMDGPRKVVRASAMYAAGRSAAYVALAALLVYGLLAAPMTSHMLQKWMIRALGPVLLVTAVLLTNWVRVPWAGPGVSTRLQERLAQQGAVGAALLGVLFALSFCPVSAALFFGALLPVAIEARSAVILPVAYGVGTALPVIAAAGAIAAGAGGAARAFQQTERFERWGRRITSAVFTVVGVWFTVRYTFGS